MRIGKFIENFKKEAYIIPIILSLFLVPLFFNPSFIYSFTQGKEILFKSLMVITLISLAIVLIYKKDYAFKNIFKSPIFFLLILQISIYSITNALSDTPIVTLYGTYNRGFGFIIELFLLFFIIYSSLVLSEKTIFKALKIIFISGIVVATYAILQKIGFNPFFSNYDINIFAQRVFSFSGNPSYLGQLMLLNSIIGGYFFILEKQKNKKIFYALGALLVLTALILSGTRIALIALILAVILISIRYFKALLQIIKRYKTLIVIGVLIIGVLFAILPQDRFSLSDTALRSFNSRLEIWNGTIDLIKKNPLLGYGEETFYIYFSEIITKKFLTLEENININADRIHNETLEILFSHGVFALLVYLALLVVIFRLFFKTRNKTIILLSLLIIANSIQNQFAFSDITISIIIAFCLGGLIASQAKNSEKKIIGVKRWKCYLLAPAILLFSIYIGIFTVYKPYMSQLAYADSRENYTIDYSIAINKHKEALEYTPYYSELWYELIFIDPSSMGRALFYLEQIEGNSGNVLAWKGNFYADEDPRKASEFYTKALEKNPYHPNWIRTFADMLYKYGDYENALYLYDKYLDAIPDFWKWADNLNKRDPREQNSYKTFLKNTPYFWGIIEKINNINSILENKMKDGK